MIEMFIILLGIIFEIVSAANKSKFGSDDLLKTVNKRINDEFIMIDPFWTRTMIPVAVCLAVVLLIVSIFAVTLISIKALGEPEPSSFSTFAPPGFDALWERNVQAERGLEFDGFKKTSLETVTEDAEGEAFENENIKNEIKKNISIPTGNVFRLSDVPIPIMIKNQKSMKSDNLHVPLEAPKPNLADNSKNGL